jgi:putative spermidine/putrescine transport system permease protein
MGADRRPSKLSVIVARRSWDFALLPSLILCALLLILSQGLFLKGSLHQDVGFGQSSPELSLFNFRQIVEDSYYWEALAVSVAVSGAATFLTLAIGFPLGYVLARMEGKSSMVLLAGVVVSSFVTIVVKVLGLLLLFSSNGPINVLLQGLGVIRGQVAIIGTTAGVVLGLMYYTLGFATLLFYSLIVTVPRSVEEAAEIHGASRLGVLFKVVLPICLPGIAAGLLMIFSICMGGFSSTVLIGSGRVMTIPVVLQRAVMLENSYGLGAALAILLLLTVLVVNATAAVLLHRAKKNLVV